MIAETVVETLRQKYQLLKPELDERGRRLWAASESLAPWGVADSKRS